MASQQMSFFPSSGIRQGDPLLPYIFVLCMERLAHLISIEVLIGDGNHRQWLGTRLNCLTFSMLMT